MKKSFSVFAGHRLAFGPAPQAGPAKPPRAPRPGLPPRACPRRAARPGRGRARPPRGRPALATHAARQPWPGTAPTRPPSPAGARTLAHSRPHFLSFSSRAASPELRPRRARAPPASNSRTTAPFSNSSRPQLRLAFLEVALELAPPSEHRSGLPASRLRRPWRRRARPPWDSPFLPFSTLLSCLLAFANASRTSYARLLALPWPEMAAGLVAEPRRRASANTGEALCLSQPGRPGRKRPWAEALPGRRAPLSLGPRGPEAAMGQLFPTGRPSIS